VRRSERIDGFVTEIWRWFDRHKRQLPWRDLADVDDTQRAYKIVVSEIMLQQTQVPRVIPTYRRFLDIFPTLNDLADATDAQIIRAWRGMGYNSRALRLRDAARTIRTLHAGIFPKDMDALLSIKGIGHYTAAAVRNFAFYLPTPCIDTNIRRILHRVFYGPERADGTWPRDDAFLLKLADDVLTVAMQHPERTSADWHAALMDFGSIVCTKRSPKWDQCPLAAKGLCLAAYRVPMLKRTKKKAEPGRHVGSTFVPNRIFRGRIVEALRDAPKGLTLEAIGQHVCIDWSPSEHDEWLRSLLSALVRDRLVRSNEKKREIYALP
jgi:A/G-specific adenine glycosylase